MATTLEGLTTQASFDDTDIFHFRRPSTDIDYNITGLNLRSQIVTASNFVDVSTDTTISEASGTTYFCTTGTNVVTITMPSPSANKNSFYKITKVDAGTACVKIAPNSTEKLGGVDLLFLFERNDLVILQSDGVNWLIANAFRPYFKSGWINRNDWTNVHLGFLQPAYSASTSELIGDIYTGGTSGTSGILINTDGSNATFVSISGGTNNFTSGETLTGNAGGTFTVSSNTKNVDSNILHNWNISTLNDFYDALTASTDGAYANSWRVVDTSSSDLVQSGGTMIYPVNADSVFIQTGASGILYLSNAGGRDNLSTQNWYYNIDVRLK